MFLNHPQHTKMSHSPLLVLFNTLQPTPVAIMTKVRRMLLTQLIPLLILLGNGCKIKGEVYIIDPTAETPTPPLSFPCLVTLLLQFAPISHHLSY